MPSVMVLSTECACRNALSLPRQQCKERPLPPNLAAEACTRRHISPRSCFPHRRLTQRGHTSAAPMAAFRGAAQDTLVPWNRAPSCGSLRTHLVVQQPAPAVSPAAARPSALAQPLPVQVTSAHTVKPDPDPDPRTAPPPPLAAERVAEAAVSGAAAPAPPSRVSGSEVTGLG